jgi:hypothetical protein
MQLGSLVPIRGRLFLNTASTDGRPIENRTLIVASAGTRVLRAPAVHRPAA